MRTLIGISHYGTHASNIIVSQVSCGETIRILDISEPQAKSVINRRV